jgi:hypothetical protein
MKTITQTESKEKISRFLKYNENPKAYENLLSMMLPCFFGSDIFEETEPIIRNQQSRFLLDLRELFNNNTEGIISKFPALLERHDDLESNRDVLIECYAQYVRGEDFGGGAVGFNDVHEESLGLMELIDLFR